MATLDDAIRIASDLPEVTETTTFGNRAWAVADKKFMWLRPFSKADIKRFGVEPVPDGDILAVRVADLGEKEAVLVAHPGELFTIPHLDGFGAVLVRLNRTAESVLTATIVDGWLSQAPRALADDYMAGL